VRSAPPLPRMHGNGTESRFYWAVVLPNGALSRGAPPLAHPSHPVMDSWAPTLIWRGPPMSSSVAVPRETGLAWSSDSTGPRHAGGDHLPFFSRMPCLAPFQCRGGGGALRRKGEERTPRSSIWSAPLPRPVWVPSWRTVDDFACLFLVDRHRPLPSAQAFFVSVSHTLLCSPPPGLCQPLATLLS